ncbi:MAG: hypothetical protein ACOC38_11835 [Promethearchaeia archaeon]
MTSHKKDESYWLGVRDALRMVDSFLKWSQRHPDRARSLDDFINDGLIAAAKRCEECLSYALGINFRDDDEGLPVESSSELVEEPSFSDEVPTEESVTETRSASLEEASFEMPTRESVAPSVVSEEKGLDTEMDSFPEDSETQESASVSGLESDVGEPVEGEKSVSIDEEPSEPEAFKDFTKEFHLAEPESMKSTAEEDEYEQPTKEAETEIETSDQVTPSMETSEDTMTPESEEETEGDFSWDDYEDALTPRVASPYGASEKESDSSPEKEATRSPLDDSSVEEKASDESTSVVEREVHDEEGKVDQNESSKKQNHSEPPPPPPPQDEEDEDERRKRARRLFFGA